MLVPVLVVYLHSTVATRDQIFEEGQASRWLRGAMPGEAINGSSSRPPIDAQSLAKLDEKDRELALTFKPGQYRVTYTEGASVRHALDVTSEIITTLQTGQLVDVTELVQAADHLRAKIRTNSGDSGWMSLLQLGA